MSTFSNLPDLTINNGFTIPSNAKPNEYISFNYIVKNQGGSVYNNSYGYTKFYLSKDKNLDSSDKELSANNILHPLGSAMSRNNTFNGYLSDGSIWTGHLTGTKPTLSVSYGKYYIIAEADSPNRFSESNENNNWGVSVNTINIGGSSKPDLTIQDDFIIPVSRNTNGDINFFYNVRNQGDANAISSNTQFYLSKDKSLDSSDRLFGDNDVSSLSAGSFRSQNVNINLAGNKASDLSGSYYIIAKADSGNNISESHEGNNLAVSFNTISINYPSPDLSIDNDFTVPDSAKANSYIDFNYIIRNQGGSVYKNDGYSKTKFYLSKDKTFHPNIDKFIGSDEQVAPLGSQSSRNQSVSVYLNSDEAKVPGEYYVIGVADGFDRISESNENNNWGVSSNTINIGGGNPKSDFNDDFEPGIDITQWKNVGSSSIVNRNFGGNGNSLYFTGGSRRDSSRQVTTVPVNVSKGGEISFDLIFGNSRNGGENADAGEDVALEYSTNNGATWTRLALYDTEGYTSWTTINESVPLGAQSNDTNFRWRQVSHSGRSYDNWALDNVNINSSNSSSPDLTINDGFTIPDYAKSNENISFNYIIKNKGGASATSSYTKFYLSKDKSLDSGDRLFGSILNGSLDAGSYRNEYSRSNARIKPNSEPMGAYLSGSEAIGLSGEYYIITQADGYKHVLESNENNNWAVSSNTITIGGEHKLNDDFEPGIDITQWNNVGSSSIVNTKFGGNGNSLYFTGGSRRDNSRQVTTTGVNVSNGGQISFDLIFGNSGNGGENADAGEDVMLEYSINNGSSWTQLALYDTEVYTSWTTINESVPLGAQSNDTNFRWTQISHSGSSYDNWALDNIDISANAIPINFV